VIVLSLQLVEMRREFWMIEVLDENPKKPNDSESVGLELKKLDEDDRNYLWFMDDLYKQTCNLMILFFIVNSSVSGYVLSMRWTLQTQGVFITNIIFLLQKILNVFETVNQPKNIFYSAYQQNKLQFNDIDPDHL
jgi:hypothetical protein